MSMFCFQCQETARNSGCTVKGVCGKNEDVARLQDLLVYTCKGIAYVVVKSGVDVNTIPEINHNMLTSLFMTITNSNFDESAIENQIRKMVALRNALKKKVNITDLIDAASFEVQTRGAMVEKAAHTGVLATEDEDIRSLRETVTYGIKGMAAYTEHALNIGKEDIAIYSFIYEALAAIIDNTLSVDDLVALTLKTGEYGVKAMALLDEANTSRYGNPEITEVNIGTRNNPAILISGHDLTDL